MTKKTCTAEFLRTFLGAVNVFVLLAAILFAGCGQNDALTGNKPQTQAGKPSVYSVPSGSNASIQDSLTGATLLFPKGGSGTVTITKVVSGANVPTSGTVFTIDYPTVDSILLKMPTAGNYQVCGFGELQATPDDSIGEADRWVSIPPSDSSAGCTIFSLPLPASSGTAKFAALSKRARVGSHPGFSQFWMEQIDPGSTDAAKLDIYKQQIQQLIQHCLDTLSDSLRQRCDSAIKGRLHPTIVLGANYYDGFGFRFPFVTPSVRPLISLTAGATKGNIAHECGHYLNHVLAGDAVFLILQNQDPGSNHGIATPVAGRAVILEDYAYFFEYFQNGAVNGSLDPTNPRNMFRGLSPLTTDFPGIEGFGCALLAACQRQSPQIQNIITGSYQDVPVVGMTFQRLMNVIATGPTDINLLRAAIENEMTSAESAAMPALCQSIGWYYGVTGKLKDKNGNPVTGMTVAVISRVGKQKYQGGSSIIPTSADGSFSIPTGVFPGSSLLQAISGADTTELPITIGYDNPTTKTVDLGTLVMAGFNVSSVKPDTAVTGSAITIRGSGFGPLYDSCAVLFGTTLATTAVRTFSVWSDSLIVVSVPQQVADTSDKLMVLWVKIPGKKSNPTLFFAQQNLFALITGISKCSCGFEAPMKYSGTAGSISDPASSFGARATVTWKGTAFLGISTTATGNLTAIDSISGEIDLAGRMITHIKISENTHQQVDSVTTFDYVDGFEAKNIPIDWRVPPSAAQYIKSSWVILDSNFITTPYFITTKTTPLGSSVYKQYDGVDKSVNNAVDIRVLFDDR